MACPPPRTSGATTRFRRSTASSRGPAGCTRGTSPRRVTARMVVQRRTLPHLAASVRHFMTCGVSRIAIGPCMAHDSCWKPGDEEILRGQVDEIVADSLAHLETAGTVPVGFLTGADREPRARDKGPRCAAVSGRGACVDTAAEFWGCPLFARSLRRLPPLADSAADLVSLGSVHDPALTARLAALPERARQHPLFSTDSRRCGARRCRDCEFAADCWICPAAICESGHGLDPHEIPEFHCAFSRVTLEARRRFRDMRAPAGAPEMPGRARRGAAGGGSGPAIRDGWNPPVAGSTELTETSRN